MRKITILGVILMFAAIASAQVQVQVAILDSDNTKEFFVRHYNGCPYLTDGDEYLRYFKGWEYALDQETPIPYNIIHDADVTETGLADYKLLILSNNASLSVEQTKAVKQWVLKGGRLLATFGSGYKSTIEDTKEDDLLKEQKGGTFGLHELWHDPMTKVFSSFNITSGVDIRISSYEGPTGCPVVEESLSALDNVLPYGAESNILTQRPEKEGGPLGFVTFGTADWSRPTPAILTEKVSKGLVVYFSFAPEYIVSLAYLPEAINASCPHDVPAFAYRADLAIPLMRCTVEWLLAN